MKNRKMHLFGLLASIGLVLLLMVSTAFAVGYDYRLEVVDAEGDTLLNPLTIYFGNSTSIEQQSYSEAGSPVALQYFNDDYYFLTKSAEPNGEDTTYRMWVSDPITDLEDLGTVGSSVYYRVYQPEAGDFVNVTFDAPGNEGKFLLYTMNYSSNGNSFGLNFFELNPGDELAFGKANRPPSNIGYLRNIDYTATDSEDNNWRIDFYWWDYYLNASEPDFGFGGELVVTDLDLESAPAMRRDVKSLGVASGGSEGDTYYFRPDRYVSIDFDRYDQYGNEIGLYDIEKNGQEQFPYFNIYAADGSLLTSVEYDYYANGYFWKMPEGTVEDSYTLEMVQDTGPYAGVVTQQFTIIPDVQAPVIDVEVTEDADGNLDIAGTVTDDKKLDSVDVEVDDISIITWGDGAVGPAFANPDLELVSGPAISADGRQLSFHVRLNKTVPGSHEVYIITSDGAENYSEATQWQSNYAESAPEVISTWPENGTVTTDRFTPVAATVYLPQESMEVSAASIYMTSRVVQEFLPQTTVNDDGTVTFTIEAPSEGWSYEGEDREVTAELTFTDSQSNTLIHTWRFSVDTRAPELYLESASNPGREQAMGWFVDTVGAGPVELMLSFNEQPDLDKTRVYIAPGEGRGFLADTVSPQMVLPPPDLDSAEQIQLEYYGEIAGKYYYTADYTVTADTANGMASVYAAAYDNLGNWQLTWPDEFNIDTIDPDVTGAIMLPIVYGLSDSQDVYRDPIMNEYFYTNNYMPMLLGVEYKYYWETEAPFFLGTADLSRLNEQYENPLPILEESDYRKRGGASVSEDVYSYEYFPYPEDWESVEELLYTDLPSYQDGDKAFTVTLTDLAGNSGSFEGHVFVDNTPPLQDITVRPAGPGLLEITVRPNEELFQWDIMYNSLGSVEEPELYVGPIIVDASFGSTKTFMGQTYGRISVDWQVYGDGYQGLIDDLGYDHMAVLIADRAWNEGVGAYTATDFNPAEGIAVALPDGTSVDIPEQAVAEVGALKRLGADLEVRPLAPGQDTLDGYYIAGNSVQVLINGQEDYQFSEPASITLPVTTVGFADEQMAVAYFDAEAGQWVRLDTTVSEVDDVTYLTAAADQAGHFAALGDVTGPSINIGSPQQGSTTTAGSITVTGTAESGAAVTVGRTTVTAGADGAFTVSVSLNNGTNTIEITVTDWAGNATVETLTVTRRSSGGRTTPDNTGVRIVDPEVEDQLGQQDDERIQVEMPRQAADDGSRTVVMTSQVLKQVSESGRNLVVKTDDVEFNIPPAALDIDELQQAGDDRQVKISVKAVEEDLTEEIEDGSEIEEDIPETGTRVAKIYEFTISVAGSDDEGNEVGNFSKKIKVRLKYETGEGVDEQKLGIYRYNEETGKWQYVGGVVDAQQQVIEVELDHFSKYTVLEYGKTFDDIQEHWAKNEIEIMAARHIARGMTNDTFMPEEEVTRAQWAVLLVRALGIDMAAPEGATFRDVSSNSWYYDAVEAAVQAGLVNGTGDALFAPEQKISRQEMAVMTARALTYAGYPVDLSDADVQAGLSAFQDGTEIADWAKQAIAACVNRGIIQGRTAQNLAPGARATRAESIVILKRFMTASKKL